MVTKNTVRRAIRFKSPGENLDIEITKVAAVKADIDTLFAIERMKDGTHRLTYNAVRIPDFTKIEGIEIIREDI